MSDFVWMNNNKVTPKMDPAVTQDSGDLISIPADLLQFLGDLQEGNSDLDVLMNQTLCRDDVFMDVADESGFDLIKLMDEDANPATAGMLDGNPAPPCAVRVDEPYLNPYVNSAEMGPPSPEMIHIHTITTGIDEPALELTGNYLEPISAILQQSTCDSMLQADSITSLQPASCGLMMQGGTEPISQPASPFPMMQVNAEPLSRPSSTGFMMQDSSESSIQPASPGDFLNSPSLANEQATLTVTSASPPIQPASTVQPIKLVLLGPASLVDPVLPSTNIKNETNTIIQELSVGPKKRGRKPKYPDGMRPKRNRPKKAKVYEMYPLNDPEKEKRRKNAINAKMHRDKAKQERETLAQLLKEVTLERDQLVKENKALKACLQQQDGFVVL